MVALPESHVDLLDRPILAALGTVEPNGAPQITPIWILRRGDQLLINTASGRRKYWNLIKREHVTAMLVDPENTQRYIEVIGKVSEVVHDAVDDIHELSRKYTGNDFTYFEEGKQRVTFVIDPVKVVVG